MGWGTTSGVGWGGALPVEWGGVGCYQWGGALSVCLSVHAGGHNVEEDTEGQY